MSDVTLTISRTSAAALVVGGNRLDALSVIAETIARPARVWRTTYADPSPWYAGQVLTAAVPEHTNLSFDVRVRGTTAAEVASRRKALEAALSQFSYRVVLTEGGVSERWRCDPGQLTPKPLTPGEAVQHIRVCSVSIPCWPYPEVV